MAAKKKATKAIATKAGANRPRKAATKKQAAEQKRRGVRAFNRAGVLRRGLAGISGQRTLGSVKVQRKKLARKAVRGGLRQTGRRVLKAGRGHDPK